MTKIRWKFNWLTKEEKEEIEKRILLCKECPFNSVNAVAAGMYKTDRLDLHCKFCGCNIELFTACLDCNCSIEKLNKENKLNIPLRWTAIKL